MLEHLVSMGHHHLVRMHPCCMTPVRQPPELAESQYVGKLIASRANGTPMGPRNLNKYWECIEMRYNEPTCPSQSHVIHVASHDSIMSDQCPVPTYTQTLIEPTTTPLLPLALSSLLAVQGCLEFLEHIEVPPSTDPEGPIDVINNCHFVVTVHEVDYKEFYSWNPSLQVVSPYCCFLQPGYRYCVRHRDATGRANQNRHARAISSDLLC